ncbi:hypothetical protein HDU83_008806 [Entophlyctis luteolus]|nr:hypothetical protein HDU83_008806 [Entophlyctis luteolus]
MRRALVVSSSPSDVDSAAPAGGDVTRTAKSARHRVIRDSLEEDSVPAVAAMPNHSNNPHNNLENNADTTDDGDDSVDEVALLLAEKLKEDAIRYAAESLAADAEAPLSQQDSIVAQLCILAGVQVPNELVVPVRCGLSVVGTKTPDATRPSRAIRLAYPGVSSLHALVDVSSPSLAFVEDLYSTNFTGINATVLRPRRMYQVRHGDRIEFGPVSCVFEFVPPPVTHASTQTDALAPLPPAPLHAATAAFAVPLPMQPSTPSTSASIVAAAAAPGSASAAAPTSSSKPPFAEPFTPTQVVSTPFRDQTQEVKNPFASSPVNVTPAAARIGKSALRSTVNDMPTLVVPMEFGETSDTTDAEFDQALKPRWQTDETQMIAVDGDDDDEDDPILFSNDAAKPPGVVLTSDQTLVVSDNADSSGRSAHTALEQTLYLGEPHLEDSSHSDDSGKNALFDQTLVLGNVDGDTNSDAEADNHGELQQTGRHGLAVHSEQTLVVAADERSGFDATLPVSRDTSPASDSSKDRTRFADSTSHNMDVGSDSLSKPPSSAASLRSVARKENDGAAGAITMDGIEQTLVLAKRGESPSSSPDFLPMLNDHQNASSSRIAALDPPPPADTKSEPAIPVSALDGNQSETTVEGEVVSEQAPTARLEKDVTAFTEPAYVDTAEASVSVNLKSRVAYSRKKHSAKTAETAVGEAFSDVEILVDSRKELSEALDNSKGKKPKKHSKGNVVGQKDPVFETPSKASDATATVQRSRRQAASAAQSKILEVRKNELVPLAQTGAALETDGAAKESASDNHFTRLVS